MWHEDWYTWLCYLTLAAYVVAFVLMMKRGD